MTVWEQKVRREDAIGPHRTGRGSTVYCQTGEEQPWGDSPGGTGGNSPGETGGNRGEQPWGNSPGGTGGNSPGRTGGKQRKAPGEWRRRVYGVPRLAVVVALVTELMQPALGLRTSDPLRLVLAAPHELVPPLPCLRLDSRQLSNPCG